jgi:hypothetical protein
VRAAVGLGRLEDDPQAVRARAAEARSIAGAIANPVRRARCEAAIATLAPAAPQPLRQVA